MIDGCPPRTLWRSLWNCCLAWCTLRCRGARIGCRKINMKSELGLFATITISSALNPEDEHSFTDGQAFSCRFLRVTCRVERVFISSAWPVSARRRAESSFLFKGAVLFPSTSHIPNTRSVGACKRKIGRQDSSRGLFRYSLWLESYLSITCSKVYGSCTCLWLTKQHDRPSARSTFDSLQANAGGWIVGQTLLLLDIPCADACIHCFRSSLYVSVLASSGSGVVCIARLCRLYWHSNPHVVGLLHWYRMTQKGHPLLDFSYT